MVYMFTELDIGIIYMVYLFTELDIVIIYMVYLFTELVMVINFNILFYKKPECMTTVPSIRYTHVNK